MATIYLQLAVSGGSPAPLGAQVITYLPVKTLKKEKSEVPYWENHGLSTALDLLT